jgi:hypothetical protein
MKLSGFTFIRNGILMGYPFIESIKSALPICDEFVVVVCDSDDGTMEKLIELQSKEPKIKLIDSDWKLTEKKGFIMSEKTNVAISHITGDYGLYIQCDEGIHEKDYPVIIKALEDNLNNKKIKGFEFNYIHFFGGYFSYAKKSEKKFFYDKEVRIIRNDKTVISWGDAMGFKDIKGNKIHVENGNAILLNSATVYHYGRAKNPASMYKKEKAMEELYNGKILNFFKNWVSNFDPRVDKYIYSDFNWLERINKKNLDFHPEPFRKLAAAQNWDIDDFKNFMPQKKGIKQHFKMFIYRIVKDSINESKNAAMKIRKFFNFN